MFTLLTTLVSFLAGGLPKLMDFFQDKSDKAHELDLVKMQTEREMLMLKEGYIAQAKVEEILQVGTDLRGVGCGALFELRQGGPRVNHAEAAVHGL